MQYSKSIYSMVQIIGFTSLVLGSYINNNMEQFIKITFKKIFCILFCKKNLCGSQNSNNIVL